MDYIIRPIEIQDLPQAYRLLVDLIRYENSRKPLKLTLEGMEQELFGPKADWHGLVAVQNADVVGLCCYSFANTSRPMNSTPLIHVDDFYVHPNHRKLGIGERLLKELGKIAQRSHISRIELWCLKNNNLGQNFYQKLGAEKLDHIDVYRFNVDKLKPV